MLLKRIAYFFSIIDLLFLSACSSMYIPSMPSLPLLEEKGDAQVDLSASTNSLRLSGNYALSNKFAVMVNGNLSYKNFTNYYDIFTKEDFEEPSEWFVLDNGEFAHKYAELGIGWYNILKNPRINYTKLKFEVFGGVGYGNATDQELGSALQYNAKYYTGFIQPNMGISFTKKFTLGWGLRLATSFYDYSYQDHSNYGHQNDKITTHFATFSLFNIEPVAMVRVGGSKLRFIAQYGISLPFPSQSLEEVDAGRGIDNGFLNTTIFHISVGIHYSFGSRINH